MEAEQFLDNDLKDTYQVYDETGVTLITGIEHSEICRIMDEYADHKLKLLGIADVSITEGQSCKCGNNTFTHRHTNWIECTSCNKIKVLQD